ncbi:hypothetical protein [Variovorax sp. YR752]|uniref:hypothetical protein n=1 Tax=Variovorax sp. YR752 TaxID=1884383 RepID=UPI000BE2BF37|nr:hypothetical protein [Variovorax sp. YR752]
MLAALRQLNSGKQPSQGPRASMAHLGFANLRRALIQRGLATATSRGDLLAITDAGRMAVCETAAKTHAIELLRALEVLVDVCTNMDLEHEKSRPTEEEYCAAMDAAEGVIAKVTGCAS